MRHFCKSIGVGFALSMAAASFQASAGVIFQDNFDSQPNYVGDDYLSGDNHDLWANRGDPVPKGWDAVSLWSMFYGKPSFLQITSANSDKAYGGTGKSLVIYRGSGSVAWSGDAQLAKNFDPGYSQMYVSFWIKFQPGWTPSGHSKIFRIGTYPPGTTGSPYWSHLGMGFIWDWVEFSQSGVRNDIFLTPVQGGKFDNPNIGRSPAYYNGYNLINCNYTICGYDLNNDGKVDNNPEIKNQETGSIIPDDKNLIATQNMIFGSAWHHLEFYVKVNSSPGAQDGVLAQWFDGHLILLNKTIPWIQSDDQAGYKFNAIKFGGNDFFQAFPYSDHVAQWYSIDNVVVRDDLPPGKTLNGSLSNPPSAPADLRVN